MERWWYYTMDNSKTNNFIDDYERDISRIFDISLPPNFESLKKDLKDKREFGLKKYGDISFQSSISNALSVDTKQHALEELIDYINYIGHEIFKASVNNDVKKELRAFDLIKQAAKLYIDTSNL